jgi:hypothetical protein
VFSVRYFLENCTQAKLQKTALQKKYGIYLPTQ